LREGLFIKKNKDRWQRVEKGGARNANELAKDFTQLIDDLSYAKTFYPASRVTTYLNALASRIYLGIYRRRKEKLNRIIRFFKYDVPFTIGKHHFIILSAFLVFLLFFPPIQLFES
jgi:hypothetical protein